MINLSNRPFGMLWVLSTLLLTACSGLPGSKSEFSCQAPENVSCNSVLGTYLNTLNVSAQKKFVNTQQKDTGENSDASSSQMGMPASRPAAALSPANSQRIDSAAAKGRDAAMGGEIAIDYTPAQTLRMWIAPYVDDENNYLGSRFVHLVLRPGGWSPILPRAGQASSPQGLLVKRATAPDAPTPKDTTKPDARASSDKNSTLNNSVASSGMRAIISPATVGEPPVATPSASAAPLPAVNNVPASSSSGTVPSFLAPR